MPYNNNQQFMYPQSYQPMQANSYMMQPQYQPQSNSGLIWVQGENAAKAYPVQPGTSQLLMDSESECFYIKTTDASGMPLPLRTFTYREVINTPKNNMQSMSAQQNTVPQIDTSAFVTRTEFNELKQLLEDLTSPSKGD